MAVIGNHSVVSHLAPEIRSAVIAYMHKHDLDKEFAVLSLITKALRSEGLLTQEVYEFYLNRYGKTVSSMATNLKPTPLTIAELTQKHKLEEMSRLFTILPSQWDIHPTREWREKQLDYAEKWSDKVPEAKTFLERFRNKI